MLEDWWRNQLCDPTYDMSEEEKIDFLAKNYGLSKDEIKKRRDRVVLGQKEIMSDVLKSMK